MTAFPWIEGVSDPREYWEAMLKRGVMFVPGDCFGMPSHFRLGFAATSTGFTRTLERAAEAIAGLDR